MKQKSEKVQDNIQKNIQTSLSSLNILINKWK